MEILKAATEWAKDEVFSSKFFILFGILFVIGTVGFWQLGKTEVARAFLYPTLVSGAFLLTVGFGLFFTNMSRLSNFEANYKKNPSAFVSSEIARTEKTMQEYQNVVFKAIPILIVVAALLIVFISTPIWRAISITTIAMLVCILLVDSNAHSRIKAYHKQLMMFEK